MTAGKRIAEIVAANRALIAFLVVGGTAAGIYAVISSFLVRVFPGFEQLIAILVHLCMIPLVYFTHRHVTFRSAGRISRELFGYGLLQLVSISISSFALVRLLTGNLIVDLCVFLLIAVVAAVVSFAISKTLIFYTPPP